jgi:hypothetical protein
MPSCFEVRSLRIVIENARRICVHVVYSKGVPISPRGTEMSFEQALDILTRDERFKATVYAMNTLLIHKGIYTEEEFQRMFIEWALKHVHHSTENVSHASKVPA